MSKWPDLLWTSTQTLSLFLALLCSCLLRAQDFRYPKLPPSGNALPHFLVPDWFLKDSAAGDLNGDQHPDWAFVLEYKDTVAEKRPNGYVNRGSPRILAVLLHDPASGRYRLFLQNNTFITRYGEGGMDPEAYGELGINKGLLTVTISFLRGSVTYTFRMQQNDLCLIGGTNAGVSGGIYSNFDANFSTRKAKVEEGKIEEDKPKIRSFTLPHVPLKRLRELKMPLQWEVVKHHYL